MLFYCHPVAIGDVALIPIFISIITTIIQKLKHTAASNTMEQNY